MMMALFEELQSIHLRTAVLEALEWDEEALESVMTELQTLLFAAPPNIDKALFWIRETPWDCFGGQRLPSDIYGILDKEIRRQQQIFLHRTEASRVTKLPEYGEWD